MRKTLSILSLIAAILIAPAILEPKLDAQGYSGALPNVSAASGTSLRAVYTAGTVSNGGSRQAITADPVGLLTTASQGDCAAPTFTACNIIYWTSSTALATTTSVATAFKPGNIVIAYVTTDGTDILAVTPASWSPGIASNTQTDRFSYASPSNCIFTPTTTAAASGWPKWILAASGEPVYEFKTDTTGGTVKIDCILALPPSRSTSGTGNTVTGVDVLYSIVGVTATSVSDPSFSTVTGPGTAGGAAAGTVASAGGSLTLLPTTGTWQAAAVTSGLLYRGSATFGTPVAVNTVNQLLTITITVTTPGTTACQIDLAGFIIKFKGAA